MWLQTQSKIWIRPARSLQASLTIRNIWWYKWDSSRTNYKIRCLLNIWQKMLWQLGSIPEPFSSKCQSLCWPVSNKDLQGWKVLHLMNKDYAIKKKQWPLPKRRLLKMIQRVLLHIMHKQLARKIVSWRKLNKAFRTKILGKAAHPWSVVRMETAQESLIICPLISQSSLVS